MNVIQLFLKNRDTPIEIMTGQIITPQQTLITQLEAFLAPLGYAVVQIETLTLREKVLRIFIEHIKSDASTGIGVNDCVTVTHALNAILDDEEDQEKSNAHKNHPLRLAIDAIYHTAYELEVSSPGIDRPLRKLNDFIRFTGESALIHTFRPLTSNEIENESYFTKNNKQKKFQGTLQGITPESSGNPETSKVLLSIAVNKKSAEGIKIPFSLISKANLEPDLAEVLKRSKETRSEDL